MTTYPTLPLVFSFAASDPTGGAGIQADIATCMALGAHAFSAVTALTVQDSHGVSAFLPVDSEWVILQAQAVLRDCPVQVFKLGVLGSIANVEAVASVLTEYPDVPVIFDPVLSSGRGDNLADDGVVEAMQRLLLPLTHVLTPNTRELYQLAGMSDDVEISQCVDRILAMGAAHVFLTGSHAETDQVTNTLWGKEGLLRSDDWARLPHSYHGSGCTLASALAAELAGGAALLDAVFEAQQYTWDSLAAGVQLGSGQLFPDRLFWARCTEDHEHSEHC